MTVPLKILPKRQPTPARRARSEGQLPVAERRWLSSIGRCGQSLVHPIDLMHRRVEELLPVRKLPQPFRK